MKQQGLTNAESALRYDNLIEAYWSTTGILKNLTEFVFLSIILHHEAGLQQWGNTAKQLESANNNEKCLRSSCGQLYCSLGRLHVCRASAAPALMK